MSSTAPAATERSHGLLAELDEIGRRFGDLVARLDADALEPAVAVAALRTLTSLEKTVTAGEAMVARRIDACRAHAAAGFRSTEQLLASMAGTSQGQAIRLVETGKRLATHSLTATALREGRVSVEQAHAVTTAADAAPSAEGELLRLAEQESLRRLQARAREVRIAADDDRLGRYERQRAARCLRHGIDDEGMGWGHWRLPPDEHAAVVNRLERQADREYRRAHRQGHREPHDRFLADALVGLTTRRNADDAASRDSRADVVVHVSLAYLHGREPGPDDVCMVRGGGSIPVERVREFLDGNAFLKAVVHDGADVVKVQHFGRHRPAEIDTALEARAVLADGDVVCSAEGCDQRLGIEWDHRRPHAMGGSTSYENLRPQCRAHHRAKTAADRARRRRERDDPP